MDNDTVGQLVEAGADLIPVLKFGVVFWVVAGAIITVLALGFIVYGFRQVIRDSREFDREWNKRRGAGR